MSVGTSGWVMRDVSTSSISDATYVIVTGDLSSAGQGDIQTISGMLYGYCGLGTDGSVGDPTSPCGRLGHPAG